MKTVTLYAVTQGKAQVQEHHRFLTHRRVVWANDGERVALPADLPDSIACRIIEEKLPVQRVNHYQHGQHLGGEYDWKEDKTYFHTYVAMTPEMQEVFDMIWAAERGVYIEITTLLNRERHEAQWKCTELEAQIEAYRALPWYTRLWAAIRGREFEEEMICAS